MVYTDYIVLKRSLENIERLEEEIDAHQRECISYILTQMSENRSKFRKLIEANEDMTRYELVENNLDEFVQISKKIDWDNYWKMLEEIPEEEQDPNWQMPVTGVAIAADLYGMINGKLAEIRSLRHLSNNTSDLAWEILENDNARSSIMDDFD